MSHVGTRRSQCEAEDIAVNFTTSPDGGNRALRYVESCRPLVGQTSSHLKTTGGEPREDTLAYVVNFADSMGFAIVSADLRILDDVLAFVETGNLGDSTDNPGLTLFLDLAEDYMLKSIEDFEATKDSVSNELDRKLSAAEEPQEGNRKQAYPNEEMSTDYYSTTKPWATTSKVGPLSAVEWGQQYEYFKVDGFNCNVPVGCVATATIQLMATWKYGYFEPNFITGLSLWDDIVKYSCLTKNRNRELGYKKWEADLSNAPESVKSSIVMLLYDICFFLKPNYGCEKTGAELSTAVDYLKGKGYITEGSDGYNFDKCKSSLDNKRIIPIRGCSFKNKHKHFGINFYNSYSGCHAWLIDGYLIQTEETTHYRRTKHYAPWTYVETKEIGKSYKHKRFLHNNWGWESSCNGFYAEGVFDAYQGYAISSGGEGNKSCETSEREYNYQYHLTIHPNIRKP